MFQPYAARHGAAPIFHYLQATPSVTVPPARDWRRFHFYLPYLQVFLGFTLWPARVFSGQMLSAALPIPMTSPVSPHAGKEEKK